MRRRLVSGENLNGVEEKVKVVKKKQPSVLDNWLTRPKPNVVDLTGGDSKYVSANTSVSKSVSVDSRSRTTSANESKSARSSVEGVKKGKLTNRSSYSSDESDDEPWNDGSGDNEEEVVSKKRARIDDGAFEDCPEKVGGLWSEVEVIPEPRRRSGVGEEVGERRRKSRKVIESDEEEADSEKEDSMDVDEEDTVEKRVVEKSVPIVVIDSDEDEPLFIEKVAPKVKVRTVPIEVIDSDSDEPSVVDDIVSKVAIKEKNDSMMIDSDEDVEKVVPSVVVEKKRALIIDSDEDEPIPTVKKKVVAKENPTDLGLSSNAMKNLFDFDEIDEDEPIVFKKKLTAVKSKPVTPKVVKEKTPKKATPKKFVPKSVAKKKAVVIDSDEEESVIKTPPTFESPNAKLKSLFDFDESDEEVSPVKLRSPLKKV
jgi:hypothetical protein